MMRSALRWSIAAVVAVVAVLCTVLVWRHVATEAAASSQLYVGLEPIPKNASSASDAELSQLLSRDFQIVRRLRYVPVVVKRSFCNLQECKPSDGDFDMVDPGRTMSTDLVLKGVSQRRLVFAALNSESAILVYERGGRGNFLCVTALDFADGTYWKAVLRDYKIADLQSLRQAIVKREYQTDNGSW